MIVSIGLVTLSIVTIAGYFDQASQPLANADFTLAMATPLGLLAGLILGTRKNGFKSSLSAACDGTIVATVLGLALTGVLAAFYHIYPLEGLSLAVAASLLNVSIGLLSGWLSSSSWRSGLVL